VGRGESRGNRRVGGSNKSVKMIPAVCDNGTDIRIRAQIRLYKRNIQ
jgi:hypothetical protein